ncbi:malonyl CoA-acyl carrier protein transacylase [Heliomicrobium modesticaldum Ice1]|uniref:Malonyl CoA-acyl carrier protein transacylase n=1 Tax=Heliobacterium modesticaldum (strain ATCC 51547 / Ice1) TaxID=498761 RepID=B0TGV9_HELMI|nr:ACP S-malonyltransferase [Heliomicrobium modesticaldum]ABZ84720.1 malonyl CoA-acyl carrier protein transacylase [Heliomicrobium modesticaldum Ice1]
MTKTLFMFPGQGSQFVGMGADLVRHYSEACQVFAEADDTLGFSLSRLCFEGPEEELRLTANTQPALLAVSIAYFRVLAAKGWKADWVAGHSLGEYSALVAAGSLTLADGLRLVRQRGLFMQEAVPAGQGTMAAIMGLEAEAVEEVCRQAATALGGVVEPANFNGAGQVVIAGERLAVEKAMELAKVAGAKRALLLNVSAPFHCSLMRPAAERMAGLLRTAAIADPVIPLVANVTAAPVCDAERVRENLILQVDHPVRWEQSIRFLADQGVTRFVEVGPGKVLSGLVRKIAKGAEVLAAGDIQA